MTEPITTNRGNYWTRLGTDVTGATTVEEALTRAGMDWGLTILSSPTTTAISDDGVTTLTFPDRNLIVRDDNHTVLGMTTDSYAPVPNREVFGVLDPLVRNGGAQFVSAGETDHGRRCHVFLELPDAHVLVGGTDLVQAHLLARTRHDGGGTISLETRLTRQICTNGQTAQIPGVQQRISIRHTRNAAARIALAGDALRTMRRYVTEFAAAADHMLSTPMTVGQFKDYIDSMWPAPETTPGKADSTSQQAMTRWAARRNALTDLFHYAETNHLGRNTAWGAYNTITEWVDWHAETRRGHPEDRRAARQMEMAQQGLKDRVFANMAALN